MKRSIAVAIVLVSVMMISCQKEVKFSRNANGGSGGSGGSGNRLEKIVSGTGANEVVQTWKYDAMGRIINVKSVGISGGLNMGNEDKYYRTSTGIIHRSAQINANMIPMGIDSVVTIIHYDPVAGRYTSAVSGYSAMGMTVQDSTIFLYNGSGMIIGTVMYQSGMGMPYTPSLKLTYQYTGSGNIVQEDGYTYDPVTLAEQHITVTKYTYDDKTSAVKTTNEAFIMKDPQLVSVNNLLKSEIVSLVDPSSNRTITATYTYNSGGRPATSINTVTPGGGTQNLVYSYQ